MKTTTKNMYHERMIKVLLHIQSNLDGDLDLDTLAELTHFSPLHFHRIFKGMIGETVAEHIRRIRLERSAFKLVTNRSNVTDAAFEAGYGTVEAFSRAFKKQFGCSPSKYPEHHWEKLFAKLPGSVHFMPTNAREGLTIKSLGELKMEVRIETIEPMRVLFVRHIGPYEKCETAWETLCEWAYPKGLFNENTKAIGICYDDPQITPPEKIRYDACITIDDSVAAGEGDVGIQTIEGGKCAVTTHKGSYMEMEKTYVALMGQWLPQSGEEIKHAPSLEMYLNDPKHTPEKDLLTEIYIPLK